jgi:hypothetical protein
MLKYNRKKTKRGLIKLSVCVATISNNEVVLGATDKMITAGDIQYQPNSSKIWLFTNAIAALVAGDIQTQKLIFDSVYISIFQNFYKTHPDKIFVKDIANNYVNQYNVEKKLFIERKILSQFGLTMESYLAKQGQMSSAFIDQISKKMDAIEFPEIETLFIGRDIVGPHIYSIFDNEIICNDSIGFAAIGVGKYHAESHLMFNKYSPATRGQEALLYTHRAKKIAETAPGVGNETDMIAIGPRAGSHCILPIDIISALDKFYEQYKTGIEQNDTINLKEIRGLVKQYWDFLSAERKPELSIKKN